MNKVYIAGAYSERKGANLEENTIPYSDNV